MTAKLLSLAAGLTLNVAAIAATGGPDAYTYTFIDSNEPGGPTYNWIDISTTGTLIPGATDQDDGHGYGSTLSFQFPFYGNLYTTLAIGSNGPVYFEDAYLGLSNVCIPGTPSYTPMRFIAPLWDDLNPSAGGDVLFQDFGTYAVIEFYQVFRYGQTNPDTWEVILYDNGDILMQYQDVDYNLTNTSLTIGIQDSPSLGLQYQCNGSTFPLSNNLAILWSACTTVAGITSFECGPLTSPSGNYTWSADGMYRDTLTNVAGCDSLLIFDLTFGAETSNSMTVSDCYAFVSPSGMYTWTTSGIYMDTLTNASGCDSVLTIDLSINSTYNTLTESACDAYISPSGMYTWTSSGTYNDTLPNAAGCDSVLTINLTISTLDLNVSVSGLTLTSDQSGASYQWIDCNNGNMPIAGQTGQSMTVASNGYYAVIVDNGTCADTSQCELIDIVGLEENAAAFNANVYPNPAYDQLTIHLNVELSNGTIKVVDVAGRVALEKSAVSGQEVVLDVSALMPGTYSIVILHNNEKVQTMFVKK